MAGKKVVLIDGSSLLYRAFFALPVTISTKSGQTTNAVYGFTSMLIKLLKEEKPDYIAVAFDKAAPTFRHEAYEEYKAHRVAIPSELPSQIPLAKDVLKALRIPLFELEGYEADDILGTLSDKAEKEKYDVVIVTGDKDALQLVSPRVKILTTKKGITDTMVYDKRKVLERYGIPPEKMPDLLGLKGDPSDNIPGVPGIGEKTGIKLIQEFGSLEGVYENLKKISQPKLREALTAYEEQARLSKELAILRKDVPIKTKLADLKVSPFDRDETRRVFSELEFRTLIQRLEGEDILPKGTPTEVISPKVVSLDAKTIDQFEARLKKKEESAFEAGQAGVAVAFANDTVYYTTHPEQLKFYLESADFPKTAFDAKAKIHILRNQNIKLQGVSFDPMIAAYLLDPGQREYMEEDLAIEYLGGSFSTQDGEKATARKALVSLRLKEKLEKELKERCLFDLFRQVEMPLSAVLAKMEQVGVGIDVTKLKELSSQIGTYLYRVEGEIYHLAGVDFNINSPQQLGAILFEKLGLKSEKKTKTGYATGFPILLKLINEHPIIEKILVYRELSKVKSGYVDALPKLVDSETGRLHTSFNQVGTATGRLASEKPNLQNIPIRGEWGARIRKAFIPGEARELLVADYSQIELRILASLAEDEGLLTSFQKDEDIHAATAREVFGVRGVTEEMRRTAKAVNFGLMYGMGSFGLAEQLGISGEEAQEYIEKYFARYPAVRTFIDQVIAEAYEKGYVSTVLGRRRYIPELSSSNYQVQRLGERLAINTTIQGSAADIIKIAMVNLDREFEERSLKAKMVLQVHDELIFEVPSSEKEAAAELVKEEMEGAYGLRAPLKVNISFGKNWGAAK